MATVIRLTRYGRRHLPFYRVSVFDRRTRRDGRPIEELGTFDPLAKEGGFKCDLERATHWIKTGADVSHTVTRLLKTAGLKDVFAPKPRVKKVVTKKTADAQKPVAKKPATKKTGRKKVRTANSKTRTEKKATKK